MQKQWFEIIKEDCARGEVPAEVYDAAAANAASGI